MRRVVDEVRTSAALTKRQGTHMLKHVAEADAGPRMKELMEKIKMMRDRYGEEESPPQKKAC